MENETRQEKYLAEKGVRCPFCDSYDLEGGFIETEEGTAWQNMVCVSCDARWIDHYTLTAVTFESK